MKTIGLYPNVKRDRDLAGTKKAIEILQEYGVRILVPSDLPTALADEAAGVFAVEEDLCTAVESLFGGFDFDGTAMERR